MWVLSGEQAINLEKVSELKLMPAAGQMKLLARLDCGEEVAVASGDPNEMFKLLETLVYNHRAGTAVFDVGRWQANRQRLQRLQEEAELTAAELEGGRP